MSHPDQKPVSLYSASAIVVANIIGVGVFTSLGYQVQGMQNPAALMLLWVVGGIIALCGALTYGEIGTVFPKSGGEYQYLSRLYHPFVGFLSGWVSSTVAFAAPVAAASVAMAAYVHKVVPAMPTTATAIGVVAGITAIHASTLRAGFRFQNVFSTGKVILILVFIACGLLLGSHQPVSMAVSDETWKQVFSSSFAVSLVYVAYAYSGWNAAAYLAGEIRNSRRNLPLALAGGTLLVMLLYLLLNGVFLYTIPLSALAAEQAADFSKPVEVGYFAADYIFGQGGATAMAFIIAILLVSTISAMIIAGPRVLAAMGADVKLLGFFARTTSKGIPARAVLGQSAVSVLLILTASFDQLLVYVGFTLQVFTFLTVLGVFVVRFRRLQGPQGAYRTVGYPLTPLIFLVLSGYSLWYIAADKPAESMYGLATVLLGAVVWIINRRLTGKPKQV